MGNSNFVEQLKKWRKEKEEEYARTIMQKPEKSTILKVFRIPEVALIMGARRFGKTGLAHKIGEDMHNSKNVPVMVHLPPLGKARSEKPYPEADAVLD